MNKTLQFFMLPLLLMGMFFNTSFAQTKLVVSPEMVYNISARGDAWILFDNQNIPNGTYGCNIPQTTNQWQTYDATWNGLNFFYPVTTIVDLGQGKSLTSICVSDAADAGGNIEVATSNDAVNWNFKFNHTNAVNDCHNVSGFARYVRFVFNSTAARVREIELYATSGNTPTCPPNPGTCDVTTNCYCDRLPMEEFIGANFNVDVPAEKANAVGFVRAYQHEYFNQGHADANFPKFPNSQYKWGPVYDEPNPDNPLNQGFNHDVLYSALNDAGIGINAAFHHAAPGLITWGYQNGDFNYTATDAYNDGSLPQGGYFPAIHRQPLDEQIYPAQINYEYDDPTMYLESSDIIYQFGARYGAPGSNTENLKVASDNQVLSGLDYVQYIENWNEQDKWWTFYQLNSYPFLDAYVEQQMAYFSPYEFAAMSSAQYDGNGTTNGIENTVLDRYPNGIPSGAHPVGLQASNSQMKFVMGGLSEINLDYVRAMKFWFEKHRPDIGFPFDVINFHEYSNDGGQGAPLGNNAVSPEDDDLKGQIKEAVEFRDRYLPGVEVWLSEFGYDSNPNSPQSANCAQLCNNDCNSPACYEKFLEIQGQWNVRSFLEIAAGGADRAMMFNMRDEAPAGTWDLYATSGMTEWTGEDFANYENKLQWYYISTMTRMLRGTKFDGSFVHNDNNVRLYKFTEDCGGGGKTVYVIWSPTSNNGNDNTIYSNYALPFLNGTNPQLVSMQDGDLDGVRSNLTFSGGSYRVNVSERPKFIVVGDLPEEDFGQNCACNYINYTIESGSGSNTNGIRNEAGSIGRPYCGEGNEMFSPWQPSNGQDVVLDLGQNYDLSNIFIHSPGTQHGELEIFYGQPGGPWTSYDSYDVFTERYHRWRTFSNLNINTRYIAVRANNSNIQVGEIALCGIAAGSTTPTCNDGIQNQGETGIDCGGPCAPCNTASCFDSIQNQGETGVDCGGPCAPCVTATCNDCIQNQGETGIDCGGPCAPCNGGACNVSVTSSGGTVTITGLTSGENAKVFNSSIATVWSCNPWQGSPCGANETVSGLTVGATYFVSVQSDVCDEWIPIVVQGGGNTATCTDGIQNQGEAGIDCGGPCPACPSCNDGIQNQGETGVDCGGPCAPCNTGGCNVSMTSSNGGVTITGLTSAENAKLFNASIAAVWSCNPWQGNLCSGNETVTGLTAGATYFLSVQSANCDLWLPITIQSGGGGATCFDGIQNQGETGIDCGGPCTPCNTASCNDGIQNQGETGVDCGGPCAPCNTGSCEINLTPSMFRRIDGSVASDAGFGGDLADEQNSIGDPINGNGQDASTAWLYPWFDGVQMYLDLGQNYNLTSIHLFDGFGGGIFEVSPGLPSQNQNAIVSFDANIWPPQWRDFNVNVTTRYLTFTRVDGGALMNEVAICGTPSNNMPTNPSQFVVPSSTVETCQPVLFPNPAQEVLSIASKGKAFKQIKVVDMNGRVMMDLQVGDDVYNKDLNISELQNGIYFLHIEGQENCPPSFTRFVKMDQR